MANKSENSFTLGKRKSKLNVKNTDKSKNIDGSIVIRTMSDFQKNFPEIPDSKNQRESGYVTLNEKNHLDEITRLVSNIRVPLDNRQMLYYNRDANKFAARFSLKESSEPNSYVKKAAGNARTRDTANVVVTEDTDLRNYLVELKNLIAQREIHWAAAAENDYSQKVDIMRLKQEGIHLRAMLSKRQSDVAERDKKLREKDNEIQHLHRQISQLKKELQDWKSNEDGDS